MTMKPMILRGLAAAALLSPVAAQAQAYSCSVPQAPQRIRPDLPHEMERLQRACAQATEAVTRRYFAGSEALTWQGVN